MPLRYCGLRAKVLSFQSKISDRLLQGFHTDAYRHLAPCAIDELVKLALYCPLSPIRRVLQETANNISSLFIVSIFFMY